MCYMGSQFLDHVRRNTRKNGTMQITSKSVLLLLAIVSMAASAIYWWGVQSQLTTSRPIAIAFTAILVLAPPTLISFLIPWSPAGMLLQRVNAQTYGHGVVVFASIYLLYYSYQLQYSWWAAQQATAESGLIWQQVGIGLIGFILIPALLWAPVSSEELTAQVEQAHIVKRYELQTQADIAILRSTLLRAQEKALIGFANLTVDEREELAGVMRSLVGGIDKTLREVGQSVQKVSGASLPFSGMLDDNDDIRDVLDYIGESLTGSSLRVSEDYSVKLPPPAARADTTQLVRMRDLPPRESAKVIDQAFEQATAAHVDSPSQSSIRREAPVTTHRQAPSGDDAYARAGRAAFGRVPWELKRLAKELDISETSARGMKDDWLKTGVVKEARMGRWYFTESEAA
jgi:hypothetical protein